MGRNVVARVLEEMPPGVSFGKDFDGDGKPYSVTVIDCRTEGCPSQLRLKLTPTLPPAGVFKAVVRQDWETSASKGCLCPVCIETRRIAKNPPKSANDEPTPSNVISFEGKSPMPAAAPQPPSQSPPIPTQAGDRMKEILLHVKIAQLLTDHFNKDSGKFEKGWSDERISKDSGAHLNVVREIREGAFGPLAMPDEVTEMAGELQRVMGEVETARALMAEYDAKLKAMERQQREELAKTQAQRTEVQAALELIGTLHRKVTNDLAKKIDGIVVKYR